MENYTKLSRPPATALRTIGFGALKGKSDINPQWKIRAMTEVYGASGIGWHYTVLERWQETGQDGVLMVFVRVGVRIKGDNNEWSEYIEGIGGNSIVDLAKGNLKSNDEGWKMATTDALGNALKYLGVAGDIYEGAWDGAKYANLAPATPPEPKQPNEEQVLGMVNHAVEHGLTASDIAKMGAGKYKFTPELIGVIADMIDAETARIAQKEA